MLKLDDFQVIDKALKESASPIVKKYVISLCKDDVLELSEKVGLNEYDTKLLLSLNRDESRVATCMKFGCCEKKYTKDLRRIMEKIFNHFKRTSEN